MLFEARGLDKKFNGVYALKGLNLTLEAGEVHGLVGENGAGKSTFIKILGGVYHADGGSLLWDGAPLPASLTPAKSRALGIHILFQDHVLVPAFSGMENICLENPYPVRHGLIRWREMERAAAAKAKELGIRLDLRRPVSELTPSQKKCVEIVRAMMNDCRLLILDEPTASFSDKESEMLFSIIRRLKEKGTAVLYVSHRLEEILELTDRITVLRNGEGRVTLATAGTTKEELVRLMSGRDGEERGQGEAARGSDGKKRRQGEAALGPDGEEAGQTGETERTGETGQTGKTGRTGEARRQAVEETGLNAETAESAVGKGNAEGEEAVEGRKTAGETEGAGGGKTAAAAHDRAQKHSLEVRNLVSADGIVRGVSFCAAAGRITGLFGLCGSGRTELLECIYGVRRLREGQVLIDGDDVGRPTAHGSIRRGMAFICEDRRGKGLVSSFSVGENIVLSSFDRVSRMGRYLKQEAGKRAGAMIGALKISCVGADQPVLELSGGNQQKVVLSRAMLTEPGIWLCDEPTQAVDVGTRQEIHRLLRNEARRGRAVVYVSSDLTELLEVADEVMVMASGRIVRTFENRNLRPGQVLACCYESEEERERL